MKRSLYFLIPVLTALFLTPFSFAQFQEEEITQKITIVPSIGFEYFNREIDLFTFNSEEDRWDKDEESTKLKSYFFTISIEIELSEGFSVTPILGYSVSNYESIIFRKLPFSIELEVGGIGGYLFGGEIKKSFFYIEDFEIEGIGQYVYYSGGKEEWEIPGLNVKGTAEGKPSWMRGSIGPIFTYRGFDYFYPYLYINFNKLWGKFKIDQTIQDLKGSEDKKISGKSLFSASLGAIYEVSKAFSFKGEVNIMPFKDGVDLGLMIRAIYSF